MLIGQYSSKLTDKDRIAVPKKFRDELGDELILARWYENCLVLVSRSGWEILQKRLTGKTKFVIQGVRDIDRFIFGSAFEVKLDSQGRCVIPEVLQKYAQIIDEAVFVGLGDRIEIWNSKNWKLLEEKAQEKANQSLQKLYETTITDRPKKRG